MLRIRMIVNKKNIYAMFCSRKILRKEKKMLRKIILIFGFNIENMKENQI